ncbi:MAG: hypothetical protein LBD73_09115 [Deferribacteraceae bacterium]|jgi:hypothetical protein|nr:hypothetical protein [Deferribacteraceae bacterium]
MAILSGGDTFKVAVFGFMKYLVIFFLLATASKAFSSSEESIVVGHCSINAIIMQTKQEQARGLLGYTERSFPYGGMLFKLGGRDKKVFHTMGMDMTIRIMGVMQTSQGNYRVIGDIIKAPPGLQQIVIDAPDVFEIPEGKYQLNFKRCLGATEAK